MRSIFTEQRPSEAGEIQYRQQVTGMLIFFLLNVQKTFLFLLVHTCHKDELLTWALNQLLHDDYLYHRGLNVINIDLLWTAAKVLVEV